MGRAFDSRWLPAICAGLMLLLAALAALQYRWSGRVAAADVQREQESLQSAAALFSTEIGAAIGQATIFLQEDAWPALSSDRPLREVPELFAEVYLLEVPQGGEAAAQRLNEEGKLEPAPMPDWLGSPRCTFLLQGHPPALLAPIFDVERSETFGVAETRIFRSFRWRGRRCFAALLDERYLRDVLFPAVIGQSFGAAALAEYDFAVVSAERPDEVVYGEALRADLRERFGATPNRLMRLHSNPRDPDGREVVVERRENVVIGLESEPLRQESSEGIWELIVSRKGVPFGQAVEQRRRRELAFAFGVEALLVAALISLVIGVRRMQRLADQRMQFVATVSHELRTPASAIAMLARNQADGLVTDPDKVREYGELIHQQSRRLNETVEQTLEFAGIQSEFRRPAQGPVALRRLLEEVVEARRPEMARNGFELELAADQDLPAMSGDAALLRTAVDNLLSNALKHAAGGRWVRLSAEHDRNAKEVRIRVQDRGPGVLADEKQEIFEPFSRGRVAMEEQIPGSGLGLSLVRNAAEAHGGRVTVESEPGLGSVFTLHLPV